MNATQESKTAQTGMFERESERKPIRDLSSKEPHCFGRTMRKLISTELGRTGREVTTIGLGGQASLMVPPEGVDPIAIIDKALALGINYFDTANVYGPSQLNYGESFRKNGLVPGESNYDRSLRNSIYIASKTHIRTSRSPRGESYQSSFSQGENVNTAVDDVRRSLSQIFGDGKGQYPDGAYIDCIQIHNLTFFDEVDMVFAGLHGPTGENAWLGALSGLRDLKSGTNDSGTNPRHERLVRHIGISGHFSSPVLMYAIQKDTTRLLDTVLVAINPTDVLYLCHQHNVVPVAKKAGMGVVAMKIFTEGTYFGKRLTWLSKPEDVYLHVGSNGLSSSELIRYGLSVPGVDICITGIGSISEVAEECQLESNVKAAQIQRRMSKSERISLERKLRSIGLGDSNSYFQRAYTGLSPPRNVGAELDPTGFSPAIPDPQPAVRISWDAAYAGDSPIDHYRIYRNGRRVGTVSHEPQALLQRFSFRDHFDYRQLVDSSSPSRNQLEYYVVSVDTSGRTAISGFVPVLTEIASSNPTSKRKEHSHLAWRQSQTVLDTQFIEVDLSTDHRIGLGRSEGKATFVKHGDATIQIAWNIDFRKAGGIHRTYTRYTFDDASSLLVFSEGKTALSHNGSTASFEGDCKIVGGDGRFACVSGAGSYTGSRTSPLASTATVHMDYEATYTIEKDK